MVFCDQLRARRDAWSMFAWISLGAALMLAILPGDLAAIHALRVLVGAIALVAVAGAMMLAAQVLRREPRARDSLMGAIALVAAVAIVLVAF